MRIGINLLYLRPSKVGGSETYVRELIKHLTGMANVQIMIFCNKEVADTFEENGFIHIIVIDEQPFTQMRRLINENFRLLCFLRQYPVDILFSPANFAAPFLKSKTPQIVTVHDLQHLWLKRNFSLAKRIERSFMFRTTFKKSHHVIAISEFTKNDILNNYRIPMEKVTTVYSGVHSNKEPTINEIESTRRKFNLPNKFFYYPAMISQHKNHLGIIEAFYLACRNLEGDVELIFSGNDESPYRSIVSNRLEQLSLGNRVRHLGYIKRHEVMEIMSMATAMVFPSKFEGFGLPLLEAMQCGTPVIASNCTSIPEVAGNAAILLDPNDIEGWATSMIEMMTNKQLRESLREKGKQNAARFSWEKCATETLKVFQKIAVNK